MKRLDRLIIIFSVVSIVIISGVIIALSFCPITQADDNSGENCTDCTSNNITLSVKILRRDDGGGGGGGGGGSCRCHLEIELFGNSSSVEVGCSNGITKKEFKEIQDETTLEIKKGTSCLDYLDVRLRKLSVERSNQKVSSKEYLIIDKYIIESQFKDAHFDPAISFTFSYQEKDIPKGVAENNLIFGYYDTEKEEWHQLKSKVKTSQNIISVELSQLKANLFGILVPVSQGKELEEEKIKKEEAKIEEEEEASTYSPYFPPPSSGSSGTSNKEANWLLVTIIVGIIAIVISTLIIIILKKRNIW